MNMSIPTPIEEPLDGRGLRIGIIVARYNWHITGALMQIAQKELVQMGVQARDIRIILVPGAYELPITAQAMLDGDSKYDALICFGCVMKGETRHDVVVSDAAAQGLMQVILHTRVPVILGVICAENQSQAEARIERGCECARSAVEMVHTIRLLRPPSTQREPVDLSSRTM